VQPSWLVQFVLAAISPHGLTSPLQPRQSEFPQQVPAAGTHPGPVGSWQSLVHSPVPGIPHEVVQETVDPRTQGKPLSATRLQSSSAPLQVSAGGEHWAGRGFVQLAVHVPVPVEPHVVVQDTGLPIAHSNPSSTSPSPSSSTPLQTSVDGVQVPHAHAEEHVRVPVWSSTVQLPTLPWQHAKPLSHVPSQSSSTPLQISAGGVQSPQTHEAEQAFVPLVPHEVVHEFVLPLQQPIPSSHIPSQSSSMPLQVSAGGLQSPPDGSWQRSVHSPDPCVPHEVVQPTVSPPAQGKPSSSVPLQSSSAPLQDSAGGAHSPTVQSSRQKAVPRLPQVVSQGTGASPSHSSKSFLT